MFDNSLGSDLIRALAIAAGVLGVGRRVGRGIRLVVGLGGAGGTSLGGDEVLILAEDLVHGVDEGVDGLGRLEAEGLVALLVFRLQLGGGGALGDAVHALRLPVDAFLVTRGEGLQMEGGHGRIQDTGVDLVVHVHVAGVGQRGLRYRSDLFR